MDDQELQSIVEAGNPESAYVAVTTNGQEIRLTEVEIYVLNVGADDEIDTRDAS